MGTIDPNSGVSTLWKRCDYAPFASSATNCVDLYTRNRYAGADLTNLTEKERTYVAYTQHKEVWRMWTALIPFIGNAIIGLYDYMHPLKEVDVSPPASPSSHITSIPKGGLDLTRISKKHASGQNVIFTDGTKSYSIKVPYPIRNAMNDNIVPELLELYEDPASPTLCIRLINESHFKQISSPSAFTGTPDDHSHLYIRPNEDRTITVFNDRTKEYTSVESPSMEYSHYEFAPSGQLLLRFKPIEIDLGISPHLLTQLQKRIEGSTFTISHDGTLLRTVNLPTSWKGKQASEFELLPVDNTLKLRPIDKDNFHLRSYTPDFSAHNVMLPDDFKAVMGYNAHLLIQREGNQLSIYNDWNKQCLEINLPDSKAAHYTGPKFWQDGRIELEFNS